MTHPIVSGWEPLSSIGSILMTLCISKFFLVVSPTLHMPYIHHSVPSNPLLFIDIWGTHLSEEGSSLAQSSKYSKIEFWSPISMSWSFIHWLSFWVLILPSGSCTRWKTPKYMGLVLHLCLTARILFHWSLTLSYHIFAMCKMSSMCFATLCHHPGMDSLNPLSIARRSSSTSKWATISILFVQYCLLQVHYGHLYGPFMVFYYFDIIDQYAQWFKW